MIDGKLEVRTGSSGVEQYVVFSLDGDHFAARLPDPVDTTRATLFIDGKPAGYAGTDPQWSADSKHLYTKLGVSVPEHGSVEQLQLDGKPILRGTRITLYVPPVGDRAIASVYVTNNSNPPPLKESWSLVVGGKRVPASEMITRSGGAQQQIKGVYISPDGKHYAAICDSGSVEYVFVDGKKGQQYQRLDSLNGPGAGKLLGWTGDSSKVVYIANNGGKQYLVLGDEEYEMTGFYDSVIPPAGNHVATEGFSVTADGKRLNLPLSTQATGLTCTADGMNFAFVLNNHARLTVYLDGEPQSAYVPVTAGIPPFVFSPDSQHLAYVCAAAGAAQNEWGVCLDGKYSRLGAPGGYGNLMFSSDSKHLFWNKASGGGGFRTFVDGKPVVDGMFPSSGGMNQESWQTGAGGTLVFLTKDASSYTPVTITPSSETSLATLDGR